MGAKDGSFEMFLFGYESKSRRYSCHDAGHDTGQRLRVEVRDGRIHDAGNSGSNPRIVIKIDTEGSEYDIVDKPVGRDFSRQRETDLWRTAWEPRL
jgi:hypothetical protein